MLVGDDVFSLKCPVTSRSGLHPERYQYLLADKGLLRDLVDREKFYFKSKLLSLTRFFYSKPVKDFAEKLGRT